jgi:hypothetical protein
MVEAQRPVDNGTPGAVRIAPRLTMKVKLSIRKKGTPLYEGVHEITGAEDCGRAFADVWAQLQDRRLQKTTSIGALMEILNEDVVEELNGAQIGFEKL